MRIGTHSIRIAALIPMLLCGCEKEETNPATTIVAISRVPDPRAVPYPNAAVVCLCRESSGKESLVAFVAFKNRVWNDSFQSLEPGSKVSIEKVPWNERPASARVMYLANDFFDEFELPFFFCTEFSK